VLDIGMERGSVDRAVKDAMCGQSIAARRLSSLGALKKEGCLPQEFGFCRICIRAAVIFCRPAGTPESFMGWDNASIFPDFFGLRPFDFARSVARN